MVKFKLNSHIGLMWHVDFSLNLTYCQITKVHPYLNRHIILHYSIWKRCEWNPLTKISFYHYWQQLKATPGSTGLETEWKEGSMLFAKCWMLRQSKGMTGRGDIKIFCLTQQKTSCNFNRKHCIKTVCLPSLWQEDDSDSWMTSSGRGYIHISHRMLQEKQADWKWMTGNKN